MIDTRLSRTLASMVLAAAAGLGACAEEARAPTYDEGAAAMPETTTTSPTPADPPDPALAPDAEPGSDAAAPTGETEPLEDPLDAPVAGESMAPPQP